MKSTFQNIKEKCNIPFSKQVQTVMVLNIFKNDMKIEIIAKVLCFLLKKVSIPEL